IRLDPILERRQPRFLQATNRRLRERFVRKVRERLPPPQPQRRAQSLPGAHRVAIAERPSSLVPERLETDRVDLRRRDREPVAPSLRDDQSGTERLAQLRYVYLHSLDRGRRGSLSPQLVDQPVNRDRIAGVKHEHSKQRSLLRGTEHKRLAVLH